MGAAGISPQTHAALTSVTPPPPIDQKKSNAFSTGVDTTATATMTSSTGSQKTMLGQ
jgi:hypothetical protein